MMPNDNAAHPDRDSAIQQVVDLFLQAIRTGESPSLEGLLSEHSDLMPELELQLKKARLIASARNRYVHESTIIGPETFSTGPSGNDSSGNECMEGLSVRCPHCRSPIQIFVDTPWSEITCSSCGIPFSLVSDDLATRHATSLKTVGHFELVERIGIGGFGTVWKARDTVLDRSVALKIPRDGQLSEREAENFLREARAAAQIRHPNIVSIHEVGRSDDTVFIVSDLIRGLTLSDWANAEQPDFRTSARLCRQIAGALQHAHEAGIVHRDLKPGNILVDRNSDPHIMDFGLAKREASDVTVAVDGQVIGTPAYMSPEQARGEANKTDGRTDIYSLGVILYQLITGELPFRGNVRMLLHQVVVDDPPPPRKLNNLIPRDLENICLKCLEKDPSSRYDSAGHVADELGRFIDDVPVHARPVGRLTRIVRWCRRKPIVFGSAAATAIAVLAGSSVSMYFYGKASQAESNQAAAEQKADTAEAEVRTTKRSRVQLTGFMEESRISRYNARMRMVDQIWRSDPLRAMSLLEDTAHFYVDARDFGWRYVWNTCSQYRPRLLRDHREPVEQIVITPDGHCYSRSANRLICHDGMTGMVQWATDRATSIAPNGEFGHMLAGTDSGIEIWDTKSGETIRTIVQTSTPPLAMSFHQASSRLAWIESDESIRVVDIEKPSEVEMIGQAESPTRELFFSASGRVLFWLSGDQLLMWEGNSPSVFARNIRAFCTTPHNANRQDDDPDYVVTASATHLVCQPLNAEKPIWVRQISNPTSVVAAVDRVAVGSDKLEFFDLATGEPRERFPVDGGAIRSVAVGDKSAAVATAHGHLNLYGRPEIRQQGRLMPAIQDGRFLLSPDAHLMASWDDDLAMISRVEDSALLHRVNITGTKSHVVFSRGRKWLAVAEGSNVHVVACQSGRVRQVLKHDANITAVAFSLDTRSLVTADQNGNVSMWTAVDGKQTPLPADPKYGNVTAAAPLGTSWVVGTDNGSIGIITGESTAWADALTSRRVATIIPVEASTAITGFVSVLDNDDAVVWKVDETSHESESPILTPRQVKTVPTWKGIARVSPDGETLATVEANRIVLRDANSGDLRMRLGGFSTSILAAAFSKNRLVVVTEDNQATFLEAKSRGGLYRSGGPVMHLETFVHPRGSLLVTAGHGDGLSLTRLERNGKTTGVAGSVQLGYRIASIGTSQSGRLTAVGTWSGTVHVFSDELMSQHTLVSNNSTEPVLAIAICEVSNRVASSYANGTIQLQTIDSDGDHSMTLSTEGAIVREIEFSSDGTRLCVACDDGARIWQLDNSRASSQAINGSFRDARLIGSDKALTLDASGSLKLHSLVDGKMLADYNEDVITCFAVTHDRQHVAAGFANGRVSLLAAANFEVEESWSDHKSEVTALTFAGDSVISGDISGVILERNWKTDAAAVPFTLPPDVQRIMEMHQPK